MSYNSGDMVRLNDATSAYVTKSVDADRMIGTVIKSRKREMHQEKGRLGRFTEVAVVNIVEVMWSDGSVQKIDGRYLEKITARTIQQEKNNG